MKHGYKLWNASLLALTVALSAFNFANAASAVEQLKIEPKDDRVVAISKVSEKDKVYLTYASEQMTQQGLDGLAHYSHRSHQSHQSHQSHRSHYSSS